MSDIQPIRRGTRSARAIKPSRYIEGYTKSNDLPAENKRTRNKKNNVQKKIQNTESSPGKGISKNIAAGSTRRVKTGEEVMASSDENISNTIVKRQITTRNKKNNIHETPQKKIKTQETFPAKKTRMSASSNKGSVTRNELMKKQSESSNKQDNIVQKTINKNVQNQNASWLKKITAPREKKHTSQKKKSTSMENTSSTACKIVVQNQPVLKQCAVQLVPINFINVLTSQRQDENKNISNPKPVLRASQRNIHKDAKKNKAKEKNIKNNVENVAPHKQGHTIRSGIPAPVLNLRSRKPVKYIESSLEMTSEESPSITKKVPIYQQILKDEKPPKRKGDQYEFDSDSEKYKKGKRRKLDESSFDEHNKTIHNILKNIVNKPKKKGKKVIFADAPKKKTSQNKETNNNRRLLKVTNRKVDNVPKERVPGEETRTLKNIPQADETHLKCVAKNIDEHKAIEKGAIEPLRSVNNSPDLFGSLPEISQENESIIDDSDNEEYFGFTPPKIKIISDIQLRRKELNLSVASPHLFNNNKPNANSTMVNNVLTPWRFNEINIKRNPHFITLKQSSLPCISQEMVLDYTMVDKLNETFKTVPKNVPQGTPEKSCKKSQVQSTIIDYFGFATENEENKENSQVSLFDNDQFSPIKNRSKIGNKVGLARRRILGEKNENTVTSSTPVRNLRESQTRNSLNPNKPNEELMDFGFDSVDNESRKENSPTTNKDDRPFRISFNVNDKQYRPKKRVQIQEAESAAASDEESSRSDFSDVETENGEVNIFDDFNTTKEVLEEEKTLKKKKSKNLQKHRKRKDVRTKEEEEEAEKWAAAFNSMCEEIEQFPLEIE